MSRTRILVLCGILLLALAAQAQAGSVRFTARIDGTSELNFDGNVAWWHHISFDPPGTTVINGVSWTPTGMSSHCDCNSNTFTGVAPRIPEGATDFEVTVNDGRGTVTIEQYPSGANGYVLTVRIDDDAQGGADDYDVTITYTVPPPIPTASGTMLVLMSIVLLGAGAWMLRR